MLVVAGHDINVLGSDASVGASGTAHGQVQLIAGADRFLNLSGSNSAAVFSTSGVVHVTADRVAVAAGSGITAATGYVEFQPRTSARLVNLGSTTDVAANTLELSDAELDRVFAPELSIGGGGTGAITITDEISSDGLGGHYDTLSLFGAGIVDGHLGLDLAVNKLVLHAAAGIGAGDPIDTAVKTLAFVNTSGNVNISNTGALTIGAVDGLASSSNAGGTTTISAASPLTIASDTTSAGTLTLTAGDGPTGADDLTINSGATVSVTAGQLFLNAGDDVILQSGSQAIASSTVIVTGGSSDSDGIGSIQSHGLVQGGGEVLFNALRQIEVGRIIVTGATGLAQLIAPNDSILDSNTSGADVTAASLLMTAKTGIGTSADPLDTQVSRLEGTTDTGGIFLSNVGGDLTIGGVDASQTGLLVQTSGDLEVVNHGSILVTVAGDVVHNEGLGNATVQALGSTSDLQTGGQGVFAAIRSQSGDAFVSAGQDIRMGDATGTGSIVSVSGATTASAGRDLIIDYNSRLAIVNGTADLIATAGHDITLQASAATPGARITNTGTGSISLTTGPGGTFTLNSGVGGEVSTSGGAITIAADAMTINGPVDAALGNVTLRTVTAGKTISLGTEVAGQLSLTDAELDQVTAGMLRIGDSAAGDILVHDSITADGHYGTLSLHTGGAIVDAFSGTDLTVDSLALQAGAGIGASGPFTTLDTAVTTLAFENSGGAVDIHNTGPLTIGAVDGITPSTNAGTTTTITAASPITVAADVSSAGTLTLTATDSAGAGDDLTINGFTVQSTAGDVVLHAGDNFSSGAGSHIEAAGAIVIHLDFGDADPGIGATATINGTLTATSVTVLGGADGDTLSVDPSVTTGIAFNGFGGDDTAQGGQGGDQLGGGTGNDIILGHFGNDTIWGEDGNDTLAGNEGNDIILGGANNDSIGGDDGNDVLLGEAGNDTIWGGAGADQISGGADNDTVVGEDGNDTIWGEDGNDIINAGADNDIVLGGIGNDQIGGGTGNDDLRGEAGNDTIWGEDGSDFLNGGTGIDLLIGGANADTFYFTAGDGSDTVADFAPAGAEHDHIWFNGTDLTSFADVQAHATFDGSSTIITYNGVNTLTVSGVTIAQLTADDFIFT